jgi:hypothetical protein
MTMQETDSIPETGSTASAVRRRRSVLRWLLPLGALALAMILTAIVVPLINVNRFQRRIVTSLSESIGRPIHLDRISLTVLPLPGLTIENLVIAEDPAFGAEPFVRAASVRATLRISSLWRRRIEFTTISFTDPSINLVETSRGKWNLESILLQAARIDAAPTAQRRASGLPRFPYIEATGARLNLKLDREKTPVSLTEAEFSLWLDTPQEWHLRLEGRPLRTDINVSDTGLLRIEGTLGRAAALRDVPIILQGDWRDVPIGEASRLAVGHDAGLRGAMTLSATAHGTVGRNTVQTKLHFADLRRADFLPAHTVTIDAECQAIAAQSFHAVEDLRCSWPPVVAGNPRTPTLTTLALTGSLPQIGRLSSASMDLGTPGLTAGTLLDWAHIASSRLSPEVTATGSLAGSVFLRPVVPGSYEWNGQLTLADGSVTVPSVSAAPIFSGAISVHSLPPAVGQHGQFVLSPLPLTLGGRDFATLEAHFDDNGYSLHLTGTALPAKLLALGSAIPQIGDGLSVVLPPAEATTPVRFDLTSARGWSGQQVWQGSHAPATIPRHFLHH